MRRAAVRSFLLMLMAVCVALTQAQAPAPIDPELLAGMRARSIGPASMSGRVAAVDVVASNTNIVYVGASTGGVWKSTDNGLTWRPIFDDQPVAAIGALTIDQSNPDVVWVGTGEGNPRNSASVGNGLYKSIDGGQTWTHLGLKDSERIHRIIVHPSNSDVVFVAAMGKMWGENAERGVFKTTDGGKTWQKILYVDERTGAADLVMDPSNPNRLIAAMWDYRRWPWFFRSGGPGSGIHVTLDGGATWKKLSQDDGLPPGDLGRVGLSFAPSSPNIVYALVEAERSALLRSEDNGRTWRTVNTATNIASRAFYYADVFVDVDNPNRVYNVFSTITVSNDGGRTFEPLVPFREIHPDHHAVWINPRDGRHMWIGNDGGIAESRDRGATWRFIPNLPLAQFYHVRVDMDTPYNVYGGLQDNGSWRGPSTVWENGGIRNHHWQEVAFGDGFDTVPDPKDSMQGYAMSQQGVVVRWNLRTGERKDIRPAGPDGADLRFNWNAGIGIDPFDSNTIYFGSQFVHKSTDRGDSWTIISPDLTTNNKEWQKQAESGGLTLDVTGAENFTTIITIAPSPVERGVIWVGTDDGRIHVTRDSGKNWSSVEGNVRGVPANTWVPHIEPGRFAAGTAFAVFEDHRRSNWTPYVYKTTDFGRTWTSLATSDLWGYALAIVQDPVKEDLLFLGTEFGLYVTLDGGKRWMRWTHGFPTVSAMDLVIHPREHDLAIATHGRALYILDDIRPLRTLSAQTMAKPIHLFDIPDAQQYRVRQTDGERFPGHAEFRGEIRPYGAMLTFSLNFDDLPHPSEVSAQPAGGGRRGGGGGGRRGGGGAPPQAAGGPGQQQAQRGQVEITVADSSGKVIRTFRQRGQQGVNRVMWDLRRDNFRTPQAGGQPAGGGGGGFFGGGGPEALPGAYTVTVKYRDQQASGRVNVAADPRFQISDANRNAKMAAIDRAGALQEVVAEAIARITSTRSDVQTVLQRAGQENREVARSARTLQRSLDEIERRLWNPPDTKGIVAPTAAYQQINTARRYLESSWDAPTKAQLDRLRQSEQLLRSVLDDFNKLFAGPVSDFRRQVERAGITLLPAKDPLRIP